MRANKSKERNRRTPFELREASLQVQYDLALMFACHDKLQKGFVHWKSNDHDKLVHNAFLHSMLLAARNLLAFLYSHKPWPSDLIAEDFFDSPEYWVKNRLIQYPELIDGSLASQISKQLAHLTWDRASGTKLLWGGFRIVWTIVLALESFVTLAPANRVHDQLREDVAITKRVLQAIIDQHPEYEAAMAPSMDSISYLGINYFGDSAGVSESNSELESETDKLDLGDDN